MMMLPETLAGNDLTETTTSQDVQGPNEDAPSEIIVAETNNEISDETNTRIEAEKVTANVEVGAQLVNDQETQRNGETPAESGDAEKAIAVEHNDEEKTVIEELNGEYVAESDHNISDDAEADDQEDMWEEDEDVWKDDSDEDTDDTVADEDEDEDEDEVSDQDEDDDEEENAEQQKEISKGDEVVEAEEHNAQKVVVNLKNVEKKRGRSRKNKVMEDNPKKLDSGDRPESSRKIKVKSMGMIFMCNSKTKSDCYQYKVLGLPDSKKDMVEKIYPGMRLFLYDVDLKLLYGIYKAVGHGGYNIKPKAFSSQFPSQVRFTVLRDCLPLAEEKFKKIIKENYFTKNKFDCQLNSEQVKKMCKLFASASKGRAARIGESLKAEKQHPIRRDTTRRRRADKRRPALKQEIPYPDRPRKRLRKVISPVVQGRRPLPAPLPSTAFAYERNLDDTYRRDPYSPRRDHYRDRRGPLSTHDPYPSRRDPSRERRDEYRDRRDPYPDHRDLYLERQDPYLDRRDLYRDGRDLYLERRDPYRDLRDTYPESNPYREGRDSYLGRRDRYRVGLDPYPGSGDAFRDNRPAYVDRHDPYKDDARPDPYSTYRRDSLPDRRDVYREDRGTVYRDSYVLEELPPLNLETTQRRDVATRDTYSTDRGLPSYTERLYSAAYPSSPGLAREYRL